MEDRRKTNYQTQSAQRVGTECNILILLKNADLVIFRFCCDFVIVFSSSRFFRT